LFRALITLPNPAVETVEKNISPPFPQPLPLIKVQTKAITYGKTF
jgi:hypothetical protein